MPVSNAPISAVVLSGDRRLLAYTLPGEGLVVRAVVDGTILRRVPFSLSGSMTMSELSDDGRFVAIIPGTGSVTGERNNRIPWSLSILDVFSGKQKVALSLATLVKGRLSGSSNPNCGLVGVHWLPGDRLLIGLSGTHYETYIYDPATDALKLIPDLQYVYAVSANGMVLGEDMDAGLTLVWQDGIAEPVVPDKAWPRTGMGAISADGTVLALMVAKTGDWGTPHGWQVFKREGSEWRPAGPTAEVDWMNQPPSVVTADGGVAWTVVYQSTSNNHTVLLSHDFGSGKWEEWFRTQDMQVDLDSFHFAGLVPKE